MLPLFRLPTKKCGGRDEAPAGRKAAASRRTPYALLLSRMESRGRLLRRRRKRLGSSKIETRKTAFELHRCWRLCYIAWVRIALVTGTLLLAVAAFTADPPGQPQASATRNSGAAAQEAAKQSSAASPGEGKRKIPCKTPESAALCYWTHGWLAIANGNPSLRIWRIGTHRMLGVFSGPSHFPPRTIADDESPELPPELNRAYEADNRARKRATGIMWALPPPVFADFEVCPLEPEQKGWMQPVCVESAKKIFIEKDY